MTPPNERVRRTVETCAEVPSVIRRGTPGEAGCVYGNRQVCERADGTFRVYHYWIRAEDYKASLKRLRFVEGSRASVPLPLNGFDKIQHRVRSAAASLRRVDRRPAWYALEWLGCDIDTFRSRFTKLFREGMSWSARHTWHLDHVLPVAAFDWTDPLSPYVCGHWSNYQPLPPSENSRKHMLITMPALERVARSLPTKLLPVVRSLAVKLDKGRLPPILCPEDLESHEPAAEGTRRIMFNIRPITQEDRNLLISPPPCPTHGETENFCDVLL